MLYEIMISLNRTRTMLIIIFFNVFIQTEIDKAQRELKIKNESSKTIKSYLYGLREYFF
jgi:hypothetical protein